MPITGGTRNNEHSAPHPATAVGASAPSASPRPYRRRRVRRSPCDLFGRRSHRLAQTSCDDAARHSTTSGCPADRASTVGHRVRDCIGERGERICVRSGPSPTPRSCGLCASITRALHVLLRHAGTWQEGGVSHHPGEVDATCRVDDHRDAVHPGRTLHVAARRAPFAPIAHPAGPAFRSRSAGYEGRSGGTRRRERNDHQRPRRHRSQRP